MGFLIGFVIFVLIGAFILNKIKRFVMRRTIRNIMTEVNLANEKINKKKNPYQ